MNNPPTAPEVENFWRRIYDEPRSLFRDTPALVQFENFFQARNQDLQVELCEVVSEEEVRQALVGAKTNFSGPGPDSINSINNWWWKKFPSTYRRLTKVYDS
ncbi:hypothetical protein Zmor_001025 [Zophobas morio]|uniref:Uncharacterized protein n=1 Tax=Zophobas morio TaxID=2755281 RepID=A0AA38IYD5_9CUCU|nr:hypothetical protein Zmor_001025 [Zophobas morio]